MTANPVRMIPMDDLRRGQDPRFQHREDGLDGPTLIRYAACLDDLPPPVVFLDDSTTPETYWFPDGFHRYYVRKHAGQEEMACEVRKGDWLDAFIFSLGANETPGLWRGEGGRKNAILAALKVNKEMKLGWNDQQIARACGCQRPWVVRVRNGQTGAVPRNPPVRETIPETLPDLEQAEREGRERAICARELEREKVADPHRADREDVRNGLELLTRGLGGLGLLPEYKETLAAVRARVWP